MCQDFTGSVFVAVVVKMHIGISRTSISLFFTQLFYPVPSLYYRISRTHVGIMKIDLNLSLSEAWGTNSRDTVL